MQSMETRMHTYLKHTTGEAYETNVFYFYFYLAKRNQTKEVLR